MRANSKAAKKILEIAGEYGMTDDHLFRTTLERYEQLNKIMQKLQDVINQEDTLTEKEYVKGRKNIYTHPAIAEYTKTAATANQTAQTLVRIISAMRPNEANAAGEALLRDFVFNKPHNAP